MLDPDPHAPLPQGAVVVTSRRHGFASGSNDPARLLARVAAADGVLIEHDVPSGVQDSGRIASALRAFDQDGRVVYAGGLAPAGSSGDPQGMPRSEEPRVGKECVRPCRSRLSPYHSKKTNTINLK